MARVFRPRTGLSVFDSLDATTPKSVGDLSRNSAYDLSWTQIDLPGKTPPDDRCCGICNPALLASFQPSSARDHRLRQFAAEFIHPLAEADDDLELRPTTPQSDISDDSTETVEFEPLAKGQAVSRADKETLRARLVEWRILRHKRRGGSKFISAEVALPPRTLEALVSSAGKFLSEATIGKRQILAVVKHWDFGTDEDFRDVAEIICDWRTIFVAATPQSQRRTHKRTRAGSTSIPVPPQPNFTPPTTPRNSSQSTPRANPRTPRQQSNRANNLPTPASTASAMPADVFSSPYTPYSHYTPISRHPQPSSVSRTGPQFYPTSAHPPLPATTPLRPIVTPQTTPQPSPYYRSHVGYQTPQYPTTPISTPGFIPTRPDYAQIWPTNPTIPSYPSPLQYYPPNYSARRPGDRLAPNLRLLREIFPSIQPFLINAVLI
ncbi:hypothetical protein C8R47DRAFT_668527 [Mycena vitilis]|nr:hypothetical protein C8R47DRAFT_668527 [Mycena vitilis]